MTPERGGRRRAGARASCSTRALEPDRRHGAAEPGTAPTRRSPTTAGSASAGPGRPAATRCSRRRGDRPARRPVDRPVHAPRRRARAPRTRTGARTPTRSRYEQVAPALRPPRRARPVRDPLGRAQLGGPGRPPRRARLARRRAGPRPVRDRRARACAPTALVPRAARLVDVAPTVAAAARAARRDADGTYLAGQDGEVRDDVLDLDGGAPEARRRLPVRRHEPERPLRHGRTRARRRTSPG